MTNSRVWASRISNYYQLYHDCEQNESHVFCLFVCLFLFYFLFIYLFVFMLFLPNIDFPVVFVMLNDSHIFMYVFVLQFVHIAAY